MDPTPSAETLRKDLANWKLGLVYHCPLDSRVVVRQLLPFGWTWNFGHPLVWPAIFAAVAVFPGAVMLAWWAGLRSIAGLSAIGVFGLALLMLTAHRLARPLEAR